MAHPDVKVMLFRERYEVLLRRIVTIGCAVASCTNDGAGEIEENEMTALAKLVMEIVEKEKKPKRSNVKQPEVVSLRSQAVSS